MVGRGYITEPQPLPTTTKKQERKKQKKINVWSLVLKISPGIRRNHSYTDDCHSTQLLLFCILVPLRLQGWAGLTQGSTRTSVVRETDVGPQLTGSVQIPAAYFTSLSSCVRPIPSLHLIYCPLCQLRGQ